MNVNHESMQSLSPERSVLVITFAILLFGSGCGRTAESPNWIQDFGYTPGDVHPIEIGDFGYPYVAVRIADEVLTLPFDTGNMVGLSLSTSVFDQMGLSSDSSYVRRNSAGEIVASLRVSEKVEISLLGRAPTASRIYELNHPTLPGVVGPSVLADQHFTLDYWSRRLGIGAAPIPDNVAGFQQLQLVRSARHPTLILVRGTVDGRPAILELDTGKSRSVINPTLASDPGLSRNAQGVTIEALEIGGLSFRVSSAKEVDQTAIDPDLPEQILGGIGSDILSRFVWTVDYSTGVLWIPEAL